MKTSSNQLPKYSWNKAATPLIADSQGLELSDGSLVGWVERSETQQRFYDVLTSPPNISTIFLTRARRDGSRAPITRTQSSGFASAFNLINNSSRSLSASAWNVMEPRPEMMSSEEMFFCAVPPA